MRIVPFLIIVFIAVYVFWRGLGKERQQKILSVVLAHVPAVLFIIIAILGLAVMTYYLPIQSLLP